MDTNQMKIDILPTKKVFINRLIFTSLVVLEPILLSLLLKNVFFSYFLTFFTIIVWYFWSQIIYIPLLLKRKFLFFPKRMKKSPPINQKNFLAYNRPDLHKGLYNKEFIYKKKELHFVKKYQNNSNICEIIFEKDKKIVIWYSNINDCTEIHKFLLGSNSDKMAENLIKIVNEKAGVTFSSKNEKNNQRIPEMNGAKYSNSLYTTHFVSKFIEYIVANLYRDVFKDLLEYKIDYLSPKSIIK